MKEFDLACLMEQLTVRDSEHHLVKTRAADSDEMKALTMAAEQIDQ